MSSDAGGRSLRARRACRPGNSVRPARCEDTRAKLCLVMRRMASRSPTVMPGVAADEVDGAVVGAAEPEFLEDDGRRRR